MYLTPLFWMGKDDGTVNVWKISISLHNNVCMYIRNTDLATSPYILYTYLIIGKVSYTPCVSNIIIILSDIIDSWNY